MVYCTGRNSEAGGDWNVTVDLSFKTYYNFVKFKNKIKLKNKNKTYSHNERPEGIPFSDTLELHL